MRPDELARAYGMTLRLARVRAGMSQEQLAVATSGHVSQITVSRIERGEASPSLVAAIALASALDTTVGRMLADAEREAHSSGVPA